MSEMSERLRKAREAAGFESSVRAAAAIGVSASTYRAHENGQNDFGVNHAKKYARKFKVDFVWLLTGMRPGADAAITVLPYQDIDGLSVSGVINAGNWRDTSLIDDDAGNERIIPVARDARFPKAKQYALEVQGDSMNRRFPNGSFVTCVGWADCGLFLRPRLCVHVERTDAANRVECTVKVYAERDGKRWLDPDSTNPNHKPIEVNGNEGVAIDIKGLVTGFWMPMEI